MYVFFCDHCCVPIYVWCCLFRLLVCDVGLCHLTVVRLILYLLTVLDYIGYVPWYVTVRISLFPSLTLLDSNFYLPSHVNCHALCHRHHRSIHRLQPKSVSMRHSYTQPTVFIVCFDTADLCV